MLNKKVPLRQCIVCRQSKPKSELIRLVRGQDNCIVIDLKGKSDGRGCYICNNEDCIGKLQKQKALNKVFKTNVNQEVYDSLKEQLLEIRKN